MAATYYLRGARRVAGSRAPVVSFLRRGRRTLSFPGKCQPPATEKGFDAENEGAGEISPRRVWGAERPSEIR